MSKVHLRLGGGNGWRSDGGIHVRGGAFWKGEGAERAPLPEALAQARSGSDFIATIQRLNGFYAVICEKGDETYAAVDHTRSIPLFYGQKGSEVYISDDAYWVRDQVGEEKFDELAATEFSLCAYVTGPDTLYARVKQLQAGEALIVRSNEKGTVVRSERYFRRTFGNPFAAGVDELCAMHEKVLDQVGRRFAAWANGRRICLPLSAGRDSRQIALMLKRVGYDNVMAFTYGRPDNPESAGSRAVAERLGIPWHFVPYSYESWHRAFHSPERKEYYPAADGLSALPHIQDWPAVWELKKAGLLPADTIFAPGHAGTRLRSRYMRPSRWIRPEKQLVTLIWDWHYVLGRWDRKGDLGRRLWQRVLDRAEAPRLETFLDAESAAEKWIWQERNAKFIVNSVRTYEYWGYHWYLPLMDLELLNFWSRVPVEFRTARLGHMLLHEAHADQMWANFVSGKNVPVKLHFGGLRMPVEQLLYQARINPRVRKVIHLFKRRGEYERQPMEWYGLIPRDVFDRVYTGREDVNWFLAQERLGRLSFDGPG